MNHEEIQDVIDKFLDQNYQVGLLNPKEDSGVFSYGIPLDISDGTERTLSVTAIPKKEAFQKLKSVGISPNFQPKDIQTMISDMKDSVFSKFQKVLAKRGAKAEFVISLYSPSQRTAEVFIYAKDDEAAAKDHRGEITSRKTGIVESFSSFMNKKLIK